MDYYTYKKVRCLIQKTIIILGLLVVVIIVTPVIIRVLRLDQSQPDRTSNTSSRYVKPYFDPKVNYRYLESLLASRKFKEANEETTLLMLQIADTKHDGGLDEEEIKNFPCLDLDTINQLWTDYSNGYFGFTAQRQIWTKVGQNPERWGDEVGWRVNGKYLNYQELTFGMQAPKGHLPTRATLDTAWVLVGVEKFFFVRTDACRK
jgi:GUN4-like